MPYIEPSSRATIDHYIEAITACLVGQDKIEGRFNYAISKIIAGGLKSEGTNYSNINKLIGVLECAKLELYRRIAEPYEDEKKEANGDVY